MGVFEIDAFAAGTRDLMHVLAHATESGCTSIIGGGDSALAAEQFGVVARVSFRIIYQNYIST